MPRKATIKTLSPTVDTSAILHVPSVNLPCSSPELIEEVKEEVKKEEVKKEEVKKEEVKKEEVKKEEEVKKITSSIYEYLYPSPILSDVTMSNSIYRIHGNQQILIKNDKINAQRIDSLNKKLKDRDDYIFNMFDGIFRAILIIILVCIIVFAFSFNKYLKLFLILYLVCSFMINYGTNASGQDITGTFYDFPKINTEYCNCVADNFTLYCFMFDVLCLLEVFMFL
jgi:hypothetical protein